MGIQHQLRTRIADKFKVEQESKVEFELKILNLAKSSCNATKTKLTLLKHVGPVLTFLFVFGHECGMRAAAAEDIG